MSEKRDLLQSISSYWIPLWVAKIKSTLFKGGGEQYAEKFEIDVDLSDTVAKTN